MKITLSKAEQKLAIFLARARHQNARSNGVVDRKIGPQDCETTDLNGIGGEIAFCKMANLYPDLEIADPSELSDRPDCTLDDGRTIDIKTTKYKNGKLLATLKKDAFRCDLYALMIGEMPTYRYVGMATAGELFREENIEDLGHGKSYALPQGKLRRKMDGD